jgi:hypothetical protein
VPASLSRAKLILGAIAVFTVSGLLFSACSTSSEPSQLTGSTNSPATSQTETATSQPEMSMTCADLLRKVESSISALNANLAPQISFIPTAGTYADQIVALGGIACEWADAVTGETVTLALGNIDSTSLTAAEIDVSAASTATNILGTDADVRAYVANSGGTASGDIEVFTNNNYWISALSPLFVSPLAAQELLETVIQALPSG